MNLPVKKVENHTYNLKYGTADSTSRRNSGDAYHNCWQRPRHQYGQNSGIQVRSYRDFYFILYGWSSYRVKRLALRTHFCSSSLTYSLASWKEISPERYEDSFSSASFL